MSNKRNTKGLIPFTKDGINGKTFEKWTEEACHELLDRLQAWYDEDETNIYFKEFILKEGLYKDVFEYVCKKHTSVSERFQYFNDLQEARLVSLATKGVTKEGFTKFMLINKFNYSERIETKNENNNTTAITWVEEKTYNNED